MSDDEPMQCGRCGQPHAGKAGTKAAGCRGHRKGTDPLEPCGNDAMRGQQVCRMHGGGSEKAKANAAARIAEQGAEKVLDRMRVWNTSAEPVTDSVAALQLLAGRLVWAVDVLGAQLVVGEPCESCGVGGVALDPVNAAAWARVVRELRTALVEMERLGIASRGLELAEQYGGEIAAVVRAILARLSLSEEQQQLVVVVVPEELRRAAIELEGAVS